MARLLLTLRYDGTAFHGWQVQPNAISVQETLQDAVERVTGVRAGITGCSRTDAGVHADMFCCTLDTVWAASTDKFIQALNACLPPTVAVYDCRAVADGFHPRYDTQGKRYAYRIWNHPARNPFYAPYTLHIKHPLPVEKMHQAAQDFCGTHDFAAFCAAHSSVEDTVRTVRECSVKREGDLVVFEVEADGFLYNMVRIMAGTLLDMAAGRISFDAVPAILNGKDRAFAGQTAPAHALCLKEVYYNEQEVGTWLTRKKSE